MIMGRIYNLVWKRMKFPSLNMKFPAVVFILITIIALVSSQRVDEAECRGTSGRVVGGTEATSGQFPWTVALHFNNGYICTASIVGDRTLLTAAHCVNIAGDDWSQSPELFYGIAGVNRSSDTPRINFTEIVIHPDYADEDEHHDVAVLKTNVSILFNDQVGKVCIAGPNSSVKLDLIATFSGWGDIDRSSNACYPYILHYADMKIVKNPECNLKVDGIDENKICAKGFLKGICAGDSGGPLVRKKPYQQIGIASYVNPDVPCGSYAPGVFTRVDRYHDFIEKSSGEDYKSICTGTTLI